MLAATSSRSACDDAADRAELHSSRGLIAASQPTLVTLECTPVDIVMSVNGEGGGVYSPAVLRLRGQYGDYASDVTASEAAVLS